MGIVSGLLEHRSTLAQPQQWLIDVLGGGKSNTGVSVTEDTAMRSTAVFACVKILAETVASLPLPVYRRLEGGGKERTTRHYLYPILHDLPNPEMTSFELREVLQGHLALRGNAYCYIARDRLGRVVELWPLPPQHMSIRRVGDLLQYTLQQSDGMRIFKPDEIWHIRAFSRDGVVGLSPIAQAREAIGLALATEEFGARFFGSGTNVGGVAKHPGKLSEQGSKNLRESINETYGGLGRSHRVMLLEEGMDFDKVGIPPEDAQFLETRKFQLNEIARIYRIPPHMIGDLDRATFCLPADAEVYTIQGPKRIVDVRAGELVWSRRDGGGLIPAAVEHVGPSGTDAILRITTTNRTIRLNAKHRVLARRAVERPLQPGEKGGRNRDGRKWRVEWVTEYVPAGELMIGDAIVAFNGTPDSGRWETPTRRATVGFMEFCGLYLGDGYMTDGHATIARAKNAPYMDHYREVILQEFSRYDGGNGRGDRRSVRRAPVTLFEGERYTRFASVEAVAELRALGLGGTAHEKHVPEWVFGLADELKLAFLRGYLDADGSVDKKGRITFSSCNKELLSGIRHLCMSLGIPVTNVTERIGHTRLPNGRMTPVHQYAFTCSDPGANLRIGSHDPRYVERLQSGKPFDRKARRYPRYGGRGFSELGTELSRIVAIEAEGEEPVYDLTVADTHSFIADGVVVHNSNIEQQSIDFVVNTIRPWLVRWEQSITKTLIPEDERAVYFAEFLVDGLLRGDIKSRYEAYAVGRQNGWLSADDIRGLENMNPLPDGQGEVYLVPLNMVPAKQLIDGTVDGSGEEAPDGRAIRELRSTRSATARRRIGNSYRRVFADAAARVVRRERSDVMRAAEKFLGRRDAGQFTAWLEDFYRDHGQFIEQHMLPTFLAYSEAVQAEAADEIGMPAGMTPELEEFVRAYLAVYITRHIGSSLGQLREVVRDAIGAGEDPVPALEKRFQEWEEKRPNKIALRETVQAGNAITKATYTQGGVTKIQWRNYSDTCPYCQSLDGRTVGINSTFVAKDEEIQPEGVDKPLTFRSDIGHPPAHSGCDCNITAQF